MSHTPEYVASHIMRQSKELDALAEQVANAVSARRSSLHDADRVYAPLIGHVYFDQGSAAAQDIIFQVPENVRFYVERITFYPAFRLKTTDAVVDGPSEVSFRPCVFTSYEQANYPRIQTDAASMDALVQISETYTVNGVPRSRTLQNMPTPVSHFYSGAASMRQTCRNNATAVDLYYANFAFPSGFMFSKPWFLPGGTSVTVKVSPIFAGVRIDPAFNTQEPNFSALNEYRFTAVFDGFKRVNT